MDVSKLKDRLVSRLRVKKHSFPNIKMKAERNFPVTVARDGQPYRR
jgi:hypothetical protein